jgi:hypothetical protein
VLLGDPQRCAVRSAAAREPMLGTAPEQEHLLLVESAGRWLRDAPATAELPGGAGLPGLGPHWRVVLVRRPDRPARRQQDRHVWLASPDGARRWVLPPDAPVAPGALPGPGEPVAEPLLFVCTNGARDRCCALAGRPLLDGLRSDPDLADRVWECSHLGGHRFAPTALRLPDRTVFGRLDQPAARSVLAGATPPGNLRGSAGLPAPVQAAAAAVLPDRVLDWRVEESEVLVSTAGGRWRVPVEQVRTRTSASCGAAPAVVPSYRPGLPRPA